jgi:tetratricopeptide (TPR) repeat protein
VIGRLKGWPLLGVTLISCGIDFNAYFNTYYNLKNLAGRIDRLEEIGDTLNVKRLYDSLEIKSAYLIKYYPRSKYLPDAVFYMGLAFSRKGQYEKAIQKFREFLEFFPKHPLSQMAKLELGRAYALDPRFGDEALRILKDIKSDEAYYLIALVYYRMGEYASAKEYFERINLKNPRSAKRYIPLGLDIYIAEKDLIKAEDLLKAYLSLNLTPSERKVAEEKRGDILFGMGKVEDALRIYSSIDYPSKSEEDGRLKMKIARIYLMMGDTSKALENFEICYSSGANDKWLCAFEAGNILVLKGDYEKALRFYDGIYTQGPAEWRSRAFVKKLVLEEWRVLRNKDDPKSLYRKAEILYFHLNNPDTALKIWENLTTSKDKESSTKSLMALIYAYAHKGETLRIRELFQRLKNEVKDTFYINWAQSFVR